MWPSLGGRRFAVQIFGREPDALARAAAMAVDVGAVDRRHQHGLPGQEGDGGRVRLGADARARARGRAGARPCARAVPAHIPVTVKHRAGWDEGSLNAPEFARALVDAGAAMITVHGRTRAQGFSGVGAHGADRRRARRAAARDPGRRQRRREGRRRLPAHEARDRLRRA